MNTNSLCPRVHNTKIACVSDWESEVPDSCDSKIQILVIVADVKLFATQRFAHGWRPTWARWKGSETWETAVKTNRSSITFLCQANAVNIAKIQRIKNDWHAHAGLGLSRCCNCALSVLCSVAYTRSTLRYSCSHEHDWDDVCACTVYQHSPTGTAPSVPALGLSGVLSLVTLSL